MFALETFSEMNLDEDINITQWKNPKLPPFHMSFKNDVNIKY
jgi:hypothetical protein